MEPANVSLETTQAQSSDSYKVHVMLNSAYKGPYADLASDLFHACEQNGFEMTVLESKAEQLTNQALMLANADLLFTRWIADYPDADNFASSILHSKYGFAGSLCGSPDLDEMIQEGRSETDPVSRRKIYNRIEEFIANHAILLPLFHEQTYCFVRPEVQDLQINFFSPIISYEKLWLRK